MRFTKTTQQNSSITIHETSKNKGFFTVICSLWITLCFVPMIVFAQTTEAIQGKFRRTSLTKVANSYIVIFKDDFKADKVEEAAMQFARDYNGTVKGTLKHLIKGFIMETTESSAIGISADSRVAYVEEDGSSKMEWKANDHIISQPEVAQPAFTWSLDRVDQRNLNDPTSNGYYNYENLGLGVHVYVFDSGINAVHNEFADTQVITSGAADFVGDQISSSSPGYDGTGHGTGVAAHVAGKLLGVAKRAVIHSVRVIDQQGLVQSTKLIQALEWFSFELLIKRGLAGGRDKYPVVANMSLYFNSAPATLPTLTAMIKALIQDKVTVVTCAGNAPIGSPPINVINVTPAGIPEVITVGATSTNDSFATFSYFGTGVDIQAPGTFVTSPVQQGPIGYIGGTIYYQEGRGTSFSAPMVAGAAALYLQSNPAASPESVRDSLIRNATLNKITGLPSGTPNRLLYTWYRVLAVRNGASYSTEVAPDSLATIFGTGLNPDNFVNLFWGPESFQTYLQLTSGNILYWGDTQINFLVSDAVPDGDMMVSTAALFNQPTSHGTAPLARIAPGMFTANSSGQGLAVGELVRVNISNPNQQISEPLNISGNILNPSTENSFLQLYGTGIRYRTSLNDVSAKVGGISVPVAYAGNQNQFIGLDQVNLGPLHSSLKGVGLVDIEITVENKIANKIQVNLQ